MKDKTSHIDLLLSMLAIPAISRDENARADFLEQWMANHDIPLRRMHNNLLAGNLPVANDRPVVLLNSHIDTVPPVEGWEGDPFRPLMAGGRITALGSNDAGASVISLLHTFIALHDELAKDMHLLLLLSAEEEVSGSNGLSAIWPSLPLPDMVIVGEPTGMQPAVAERGLMVLDAKVFGKAGHAARKEGENAIYKALKDIRAIEELSFGEHSAWLPDPGAQVTMISAGKRHNVVPDLCSFVVDVRSNDLYSNERLLEMIRERCTATLVPRSTRLRSSSLDRDHVLMQTVRACGLRPFGSQTMSDMALIPVPAVKMGPGDSARSHTAGEYIRLDELEAGIAGYSHFLRTLARQPGFAELKYEKGT
ncbi:MAG: acetylornithine deacetylase [Bacteroidetes bacterium]|nr:MAG: acetylornithine deacetylase [Bacteroidota bacterium]